MTIFSPLVYPHFSVPTKTLISAIEVALLYPLPMPLSSGPCTAHEARTRQDGHSGLSSSSPAGRVPLPLGPGLLIPQEPVESEHQLGLLCRRPGQPLGLLQLLPVVREQCQSETTKRDGFKSNAEFSQVISHLQLLLKNSSFSPFATP